MYQVLAISFALLVAYLAMTPQSLRGSAAYLLGGNSGCSENPNGNCGGTKGSGCYTQTATQCTVANNSDYCCEASNGGVCNGCPFIEHECDDFWFDCD
jgi:hypothetical protein